MRIGPSLFGRTQGEEERGRDEPAVPRHMVPGRTAQARRTGRRSEPVSRFDGRPYYKSEIVDQIYCKNTLLYYVECHEQIELICWIHSLKPRRLAGRRVRQRYARHGS
jgi:hypothetical protein